MQVQARVHNGEYGGKAVNDLIFPLVKGFNVGKNGGFITVDGAHVPGFPDREIRIKLISKHDYEVINSFLYYVYIIRSSHKKVNLFWQLF